ncbi:MAG: PCYCGC motif-containing (lipo)protein, partial [Gemmatimonadales bacterium]
MIAGAAILAVAGVLLFTGRSEAGHPEPRSGVTAALVLPTIAEPRTPGAGQAYAAARAVPQVLDGLYCHCQCKEHSGHRSLLTCFESEHG